MTDVQDVRKVGMWYSRSDENRREKGIELDTRSRSYQKKDKRPRRVVFISHKNVRICHGHERPDSL